MNTFSHVPPGFRFHPTDEELVDYYLRKKIASRNIDLDVIRDVDLYKIEPWDLQELCRLGTEKEQNEWYFFSHKDKKYPTGTRTNRATAAGFWKATGRDKAIYCKHDLIGMRKTLVFYKGRAPNGQKSDWIMHEYRLETDENGTTQATEKPALFLLKKGVLLYVELEIQEEGWVVCRVFKKRIATMRKVCEHESPIWYDDQVSFMPDMDSPKQDSQSNSMTYQYSYSCKRELDLHYQIPPNHLLQLPLLESPKLLQTTATISCNSMPLYSQLNMHQGSTFQSSSLTQDQEQLHQIYGSSNNSELAVDQVTDWRVLDKFVASQLSHEDASKENEYSNAADVYQTADDKQEMLLENASTSASSCQIDLWK
ncbi:hypothetical protein RJ640_022852 [Escallonia rubra]|uniref:NAC domain-containing protein n=1 Tax=Escallonia rubra TaxID=112253 RepID=A0AA88RJU4_9ASTE|nr:hypothetical protein RJ640_022852 [Escallonia rubra]